MPVSFGLELLHCASQLRVRAKLIQFPEYFSLSWLVKLHAGNFTEGLRSFSQYQAMFDERFLALAKKLNMVIVAGTVPFSIKKKLVNRAYIFLPSGEKLHQDKHNMTRFETEEWNVSPGESTVSVFEYLGVKYGVAICYDIEFSSYTEKLVAKDVDVILVPSCTDDVHGYWRVRHCAQARAVESQSYVIMSSIVGGDKAHTEIDGHYGQVGFFTPCDKGFAEGGVQLLGDLNSENAHVAELDLAKLRDVRKNGTVLNRRDNKK